MTRSQEELVSGLLFASSPTNLEIGRSKSAAVLHVAVAGLQHISKQPFWHNPIFEVCVSMSLPCATRPQMCSITLAQVHVALLPSWPRVHGFSDSAGACHFVRCFAIARAYPLAT